MEVGNRSISTLELSLLADFYARPITEFFSDGPVPEAAEEDPLLALHRVTNRFKDEPAVQNEVSRCVEICREGAHLEHLLGRRPRSGPPFYALATKRDGGCASRRRCRGGRK